MHGPSFFSFHLLSFSISFPKLTFTILRLYMACKTENHCAHFRDIEFKTGKKNSISPLSPCIILYNWIGEHEITKLKQNICFECRKKDAKTSTKRHGMTQNALLMFSVNLFCTSSHPNVPYEKQKELNKGLSLEMSVLARARAQLLNTLYISTHLSVPHGQNI